MTFDSCQCTWTQTVDLLIGFIFQRSKVFFSIKTDEEDNEDQMEEIDPLSDEFSPDDALPPLRRILNYYKSESADNRYT